MLDSSFVVPGKDARDIAFPRFHSVMKKNEFRSAATGKAEYDRKDYVEVTTPGDTRSVVDREVQEKDKARWPREWVAYQNGQELAPEGTPLEMWPQVDIGQIEELKRFRVRSVEQLAAVSDTALGNLPMGTRSLREKAIVWLQQAKDGSGLSKLVAENAGLRSQLDAMQEQINSLAAMARAAQMAPAPVADAASQAPAQLMPSPGDIQKLIADGIAAALAGHTPAEAPKNKGGRPRKAAAEVSSEGEGGEA